MARGGSDVVEFARNRVWRGGGFLKLPFAHYFSLLVLFLCSFFPLTLQELIGLSASSGVFLEVAVTLWLLVPAKTTYLYLSTGEHFSPNWGSSSKHHRFQVSVSIKYVCTYSLITYLPYFQSPYPIFLLLSSPSLIFSPLPPPLFSLLTLLGYSSLHKSPQTKNEQMEMEANPLSNVYIPLLRFLVYLTGKALRAEAHDNL